MACGKITYNRYKHSRVDQKWGIKIPFESPYPLNFDYTLSPINWFKLEFDLNDVKVQICFHI
jgi:hypothetical protein